MPCPTGRLHSTTKGSTTPYHYPSQHRHTRQASHAACATREQQAVSRPVRRASRRGRSPQTFLRFVKKGLRVLHTFRSASKVVRGLGRAFLYHR
eukprot:scaffold44841_cov57-Phaeocystis_antarctica.AAC.3